MFDRPDLCSDCGGNCCKKLSGCMMPDDVTGLFPAPTLAESLARAFRTGAYVIDWWLGDPVYDGPDYILQGYYVRPRIDNDDQPLYNVGWHGTCTFLTDDGCSPPSDLRPYQCRMLEPREEGRCFMHTEGGKWAISVAWIPHHEDLADAAREVMRQGHEAHGAGEPAGR